MNLTQEKALYHLTGQKDISDASLMSIQRLADDYPFFAPAQSLLAYSYKREEHPMMVLQAIKTALYFTNPYWLQYQLQDIETARPVITTPPTVEMVDTAINESVPDIADKAGITSSPPPDTNPQPAFPSQIAIPTVEAVKEMMRNIDHPAPVSAEAEPVIEKPVAEEEIPAIAATADDKIASLLSGQLAEFKKPVEAGDQLDIDSYAQKLHTIDYFASQGIKIDLAAIPQDKLTTHLRKFTDWLKEMKQADFNRKEIGMNAEMENAVKQTANNSNEFREILTEAMAEVLVKQGQIDKAIQLFIKLSFLNPEKSSYFAAKIEQLKGI